jgi:hypothetical protein
LNPLYKSLPPQTTNNLSEFVGLARADGWRGYLSSPRLADAGRGARLQKYRSARDNALALAILDGVLDEQDIPRYSKRITGDKQLMAELAASGRDESERERKQREWMRKKGIE